jgi:hypothetical protein
MTDARPAGNAILPLCRHPYKEPIIAIRIIAKLSHNSLYSNIMAPSATETVTLPTHPVGQSQVRLTSSTGPYKELAPIGYEKEAEEQGKDGFQAAKVCKSLKAILACTERASSTRIISRLGAMRNFLHFSFLSTTTPVSMQIQAIPSY